MESAAPHQFRNFGENVEFGTHCYFEPRTEQEVLDRLREHKGKKFRVIGALHSWSEAPEGGEVVLSLKHLNKVNLITTEGQTYAEIGAGCSVYSALEQLNERGLTLPAVGMTGEQSIAGAISTGTHGSGRSSMSHYVMAVRVAAYGSDGVPEIHDLSNGPALRAARCALGRMGIVLSVWVQFVPTYLVEEKSKKVDNIDDVLLEAREYPLTQFYLMPWTWDWIVELRRSFDGPRSKPWVRLQYQLKRAIQVSLLNAATVFVARRGKHQKRTRSVYRFLSSKHQPGSIVDRAERILMMKHRQRYVEAELFVPLRQLRAAAKLVEEILRYVGEDLPALSVDVQNSVAESEGALAKLQSLRGRYHHHYPITFRRVRQDSTLISMSSDEEMFAISLVTLNPSLGAFKETLDLLASTMARAFGARPHWGKLFPLGAGANELSKLIPGLGGFRNECEQMDPHEAFASEFTKRVLGF